MKVVLVFLVGIIFMLVGLIAFDAGRKTAPLAPLKPSPLSQRDFYNKPPFGSTVYPAAEWFVLLTDSPARQSVLDVFASREECQARVDQTAKSAKKYGLTGLPDYCLPIAEAYTLRRRSGR